MLWSSFLLPRSYYLKAIRDDPNKQNRRAQLKELIPSPEYLFGGEVKALCQDMRDSMQLDPLYSFQPGQNSNPFKKGRRGQGGSSRPYGGGRGGSFSRSFKAKNLYDAGRGRGGAASTKRGDRLNKFKEN